MQKYVQVTYTLHTDIPYNTFVALQWKQSKLY